MGKERSCTFPLAGWRNFGQAYIDVFFATCTAHMHCLSWGHSHCHLYSTYWVDDWLLCVHSSFIGFGFMSISYIFVSPLKVPVHRRLLTITESSALKTRMKCVVYKAWTAVCAYVSFHQSIKCEYGLVYTMFCAPCLVWSSSPFLSTLALFFQLHGTVKTAIPG